MARLKKRGLKGVSRLKRVEIIRTATAYRMPIKVQADLDNLVREGMEVDIHSIWDT